MPDFGNNIISCPAYDLPTGHLLKGKIDVLDSPLSDQTKNSKIYINLASGETLVTHWHGSQLLDLLSLVRKHTAEGTLNGRMPENYVKTTMMKNGVQMHTTNMHKKITMMPKLMRSMFAFETCCSDTCTWLLCYHTRSQYQYTALQEAAEGQPLAGSTRCSIVSHTNLKIFIFYSFFYFIVGGTKRLFTELLQEGYKLFFQLL